MTNNKQITVRQLQESIPHADIEIDIKKNYGKTLADSIDVLDGAEVAALTRLIVKLVESDAKTETMKVFKAYVTRLKFKRSIEDVLGEFPNTPVEFIDIYFNNHDVNISRKGTLTRNNAYDDSEDNTEALVRDIKLLNDKLKLKFQDKLLDLAYDAVLEKHLSDKKKEIKALIQYNKKADKEAFGDWKRLSTDIFTVDGNNELGEAILKKFIWQVKRKMNDLPVTDHLMAIIYSPHQGVGKTYFITKLINILKDFSAEINFDEMTDNRTVGVWSSYILSITEMSKAEQANIQVLRQRITGESWSYRPMGSNRSATVINRATFIGDSNESLDTLIRDTKGMRRFAQLDWILTKDQDKTEAWKFINDIDYEQLWQSVDETSPDPTKGFFEEVKKIQESFRSLSTVEMWLDDLDRDKNRKSYVVLDKQTDQMVEHACPFATWKDWKKLADLYKDNFDPWQKVNGGSYGKIGFSKEIRSIHIAGKYNLEFKKPNNVPHWKITHILGQVSNLAVDSEAVIAKKLKVLKR